MATVIDRNFSDFLRQSGEVITEVEQHDVVLRRRDGEDLFLTEKRREEGMRGVFQLLASLVHTFLIDEPGRSGRRSDHLDAVLNQSAPWARVMPREQQENFLQEIAQNARACEGLGTFEPLSRLIDGWKATAWVHAHPEVLAQLQAEPDAEEARAVVSRPGD